MEALRQEAQPLTTEIGDHVDDDDDDVAALTPEEINPFSMLTMRKMLRTTLRTMMMMLLLVPEKVWSLSTMRKLLLFVLFYGSLCLMICELILGLTRHLGGTAGSRKCKRNISSPVSTR